METTCPKFKWIFCHWKVKLIACIKIIFELTATAGFEAIWEVLQTQLRKRLTWEIIMAFVHLIFY